MKNAVEYGQGDVDRLNAMVDEGRKRIRLEKYGAANKTDATVPQTDVNPAHTDVSPHGSGWSEAPLDGRDHVANMDGNLS